MSKVTENAQKAVLAINVLAATPGADNAQRLIALHQIVRHTEGQIRFIHEADERARGVNPVSQSGGD